MHPKTVAKWKRRSHVDDALMGPKQPHATGRTQEEEALMVAFHRHPLPPLDDYLYALQATSPQLTRSALHRCLKRHGINHLPETEGDKPAKKKSKPYPIGYFHLDLTEVRTEEGQLCLVVALDRTCQFAYAERHEEANKLIAAVLYKIHTVLTDHGMQFMNRQRDQDACHHSFDRVCQEHGLEHRLIQVNQP
jgi:hypothetical protein